MRVNEIIFEDVMDDILEDEANDPVITSLMGILEALRNRAQDTHIMPKVRADSLINLIKAEHPQFNLDTLVMAKTNNEQIKTLIKDIKDDETGIKYVYITPFADESEVAAMGDEFAPRTQPEKTVNAMAKSALAKRG